MFLRFTVLERDEDSHSQKGVFTAAYELRDSGELEAYEIAWVQEIIDWFKKHLRVPACLDLPQNDCAICWFRSRSKKPLRKMWDLVAFLNSRGVHVTFQRTPNPGTIIYSDENQVVAFPPRKKSRRRIARNHIGIGSR